MKLLVFAHVPPPLHGQSVMVRTLVEGLRGEADLEVIHVNPQLSRDSADIGHWRPGKLFHLLGACAQALRQRWRHGPMPIYYVPAPGKRSALYRDWVVLLLCRPFFSGLVLHWHAVGLGHWLVAHATPPERWLTHRLLGRAALALVLAPELAHDAQVLAPRRTLVVPNSVADPGPATAHAPGGPCRVLFLGQVSRAKGLFDTLEAMGLAAARAPGAFSLTIAGGFADPAEAQAFAARTASLPPGLVTLLGPVDETRKHALFAAADVFCFPTSYPHEGQPLTLLEALAHDVPIVTTRWRAIPGMLPAEHVWFVASGQAEQLADALHAARRAGPAAGALRRHYLAHFTPQQHLTALKSALLSLRA